MRILVVDDETDHRLLMRNFLALEGWDVVLAENGQDALTKLEEERVDIIISDVYMPVMDGIRLHNTIRTLPQYEMMPFLFVSAYDDQHTLDAVKNPKLDGFFKKGKPVSELKEWIFFLTAAEDQRPPFPPGQRAKRDPFNSYRGLRDRGT